jgi:hypothetical protein
MCSLGAVACACTGTDILHGVQVQVHLQLQYFLVYFTKESKGKAIKAVETLFLYYD